MSTDLKNYPKFETEQDFDSWIFSDPHRKLLSEIIQSITNEIESIETICQLASDKKNHDELVRALFAVWRCAEHVETCLNSALDKMDIDILQEFRQSLVLN